jgi:hypothetical protein
MRRINLAAIILLAVSTALTFTSLVAKADLPDGKNAGLASASVGPGGVAIGIEYENGYNHTYGVGAYFHLSPNDKAVGSNGLTTVGVFVRPHFSRQAWDLYFTPGVGLMFVTPGNNDSNQALLGPSFGVGLLYEFNPKVSVGVDDTTYAGWIGGSDPYRGVIGSDLAAKVRVIF